MPTDRLNIVRYEFDAGATGFEQNPEPSTLAEGLLACGGKLKQFGDLSEGQPGEKVRTAQIFALCEHAVALFISTHGRIAGFTIGPGIPICPPL